MMLSRIWRKLKGQASTTQHDTAMVYRVSIISGTTHTICTPVSGGTRSECERHVARQHFNDPGVRYFVGAR